MIFQIEFVGFVSNPLASIVCGSVGQLRGRKEQFVAAQILLKGVAAR